MVKNPKPLGGKAYGSIAHLPNSRVGLGDHHCHEGQARICTTKARDRYDRIIVQEKLDGSCVAALRRGDEIIPLTRAGYEASTSPYEQHHLWAQWVAENKGRFLDVVYDGERLCGEWLAQAHSTRYHLAMREPFVAFDIISPDIVGGRLPFEYFTDRVTSGDFVVPKALSVYGPLPVSEALRLLGPYGYHGALDEVEGVVYRVERTDPKTLVPSVDFLAKYVKPGKIDGAFLPIVTGGKEVWNWRPEDGIGTNAAA